MVLTRFFSRLKTGLKLAKGSLSVLIDHPKLMILPLIGGVAGILFLLTLLAGVLGLTSFESVSSTSDVMVYGTLFVIYFGTTFIASYFNAALVHCTRQAFRGDIPSIGDGLREASRRIGPILIWAFAAAVVGVIIRIIEESNETAGRILAAIFSVAWSVMTFFVVPVIVFENPGAIEMFKKSGKTFKETWGETLGVWAGVGIINFLVTLVGFILGAAIYFIAPGFTTILIAGAIIIFAFLFGATLSVVSKTALYVFATENESPNYFKGIDFNKGGEKETTSGYSGMGGQRGI